jgi:hypothetical protein
MTPTRNSTENGAATIKNAPRQGLTRFTPHLANQKMHFAIVVKPKNAPNYGLTPSMSWKMTTLIIDLL